MEFDQLQKLLSAARAYPARTIGSVVVVGFFGLLAMYASGYLGELGRQAAENKPPVAAPPQALPTNEERIAEKRVAPTLEVPTTEETSAISFSRYLEERDRYSNLTSLQREQFTRVYVGKRVNWKGFVRDVESRGGEVALWFEPERDSGIFAVASCTMPPAYRDQLMALKEDEEVRVSGVLTDRYFYGLVLENCSLVDTGRKNAD